MSDHLNPNLDSERGSGSNKLQICLFSVKPQFSESIGQLLNGDRYELKVFNVASQLLDFVTQNKGQIDCITLVNEPAIEQIVEQLWQAEILLPVIIIENQKLLEPREFQEDFEISQDLEKKPAIYHQAEIHLYPTQIKEINSYIKLAINKFLNLNPDTKIENSTPNLAVETVAPNQKSLIAQQRRLSNKIKERLGYLGVYYKRNERDYYRNLPPKEQAILGEELNTLYRSILLNYFEDNPKINQLIDEFVDRAFFADVSTSQILEIHMDLIDDFSHQLRIEGRNDDILLDYRLALIDTIAHLCEMYRRSIPGEDVSLKLLFGVE